MLNNSQPFAHMRESVEFNSRDNGLHEKPEVPELSNSMHDEIFVADSDGSERRICMRGRWAGAGGGEGREQLGWVRVGGWLRGGEYGGALVDGWRGGKVVF